MPSKLFANVSVRRRPCYQAAEAEAAEERRRYNREFMRRWRSDPLHQAVERAKRRHSYAREKRRRAVERRNRRQACNGNPAHCAFCSRPAVRQIVRLRPSADAPEGYVKIRIPYCGEC
jgi:hypothetical protein